jgi:hypothetical protein
VAINFIDGGNRKTRKKITDLPHLSTDNYEEKSLSNINKANNQLSRQSKHNIKHD